MPQLFLLTFKSATTSLFWSKCTHGQQPVVVFHPVEGKCEAIYVLVCGFVSDHVTRLEDTCSAIFQSLWTIMPQGKNSPYFSLNFSLTFTCWFFSSWVTFLLSRDLGRTPNAVPGPITRRHAILTCSTFCALPFIFIENNGHCYRFVPAKDWKEANQFF